MPLLKAKVSQMYEHVMYKRCYLLDSQNVAWLTSTAAPYNSGSFLLDYTNI